MKNVAYTLDGLGNRSQVLTTLPTPPSSVTYAADVVNQYTAVGGVARTHDNNGNLKDDGTYVFSYDFENRLVQVRQSGTLTLIADYHYDALGRRVEKVLAAGTTTRYLLDGVEVVEEYDAVGNWQARYVYEDGIDRPRCMDRADIADVNGNQNTTEVLRFHYHQQALGSVTEMTQPTGAVVEWVTYDVYGQPTIRDQQGIVIARSAIGNPYLYTGREYDPEDGLYHYRARAYSPRAGRFLQRDPVGCIDSCDLYEFVRSAPLVRVDPFGLDAAEVREAEDGVVEADDALSDAEQLLKEAEEALKKTRADLEEAECKREQIQIAGAAGSFDGRESLLERTLAWHDRKIFRLRALLAEQEDALALAKSRVASAQQALLLANARLTAALIRHVRSSGGGATGGGGGPNHGQTVALSAAGGATYEVVMGFLARQGLRFIIKRAVQGALAGTGFGVAVVIVWEAGDALDWW